MSVDWITVAAQVANFLVLVWLLKRFLYRPILDGIDAREAEIAARMGEAAQARKEAAAEGQAWHDKVQALNLAEAEMTETIRRKAAGQRDAMLAEAQTRLTREHEAWQARLDDEARKYTAKLHQAGAGALLALTRKALADLADDTLEARMASHIARQIRPMQDDLRRAAGTAGQAVITSQQSLPEAARAELKAELLAVFPRLTLRFDAAADQPPGLVLRLGGAELAWTTDSYLDGLEQAMAAQSGTGGAAHGSA